MATAYKGIMTTEAAAGEVVADRRRPRSGTSASRPATSTSTAPARAASSQHLGYRDTKSLVYRELPPSRATERERVQRAEELALALRICRDSR